MGVMRPLQFPMARFEVTGSVAPRDGGSQRHRTLSDRLELPVTQPLNAIIPPQIATSLFVRITDVGASKVGCCGTLFARSDNFC
eukprot:606755-Amphidinium_carterae.1